MNIFFLEDFYKERERVVRIIRLFGIWFKILSYIIFLIKRFLICCFIEIVCIIEIIESVLLKLIIYIYYFLSINIMEWLMI